MIHTINPVFDSRSSVMILGTFPSPKSREQGFFYGHPRNRMWYVLSTVLQAEFPGTVEKRKKFLLENHIAMWDVLACCDIVGASDRSICHEKPNNLDIIMKEAEIKAVFLAGSKAFELYRKYDSGKYDIPYFRLPSTSPANAAASPEGLVSKYEIIKEYLK